MHSHPYLPVLLQIAVVYMLAAMSPGPNFFMITQLSLAGRRRLGAASALGVGTASTIWATLAMLGFATVLQRIDWVYNGIRIAGALYLVWFGFRLLRSSFARSGDSITPATSATPSMRLADDAGAHFRAWRAGLVTCLTNPKSCAFWTSVFATMMPAHAPVWFCAIVIAMISLLSAGWYGSVALMFGTERTQRGYRKLRRPFDALCGAALIGLGAKLAADR
ncbi:LysE family translocator [Paraburkholderia rhizosphaerae]|uniref:Threonine/homoserine/homoserine lactone efflux protein n=1 Tax=Paraburkholderia rhizosphaerae TaxID=480658 RepID=A0A4R8LT26_9BURK|nr:LysE family transporter [Paraburkholderia rhizosphaerae]TDY49877.1 threonine/homoserine/homoserine lactone efflux protein [Paraburkholderia rhizosphaerae]